MMVNVRWIIPKRPYFRLVNWYNSPRWIYYKEVWSTNAWYVVFHNRAKGEPPNLLLLSAKGSSWNTSNYESGLFLKSHLDFFMVTFGRFFLPMRLSGWNECEKKHLASPNSHGLSSFLKIALVDCLWIIRSICREAYNMVSDQVRRLSGKEQIPLPDSNMKI